MSDPLLDAALDYAGRGWPVLPLHRPGPNGSGCSCLREDCSSPAKHPRTRQGLKDASTDAAVIRAWWGRWPGANIGLRTGIAFDVLDCDGDAGVAAWEDFADGYAYEHPTGLTVMTGGGGQHLYFAPSGAGNRAKFLPSCDWRGEGGYVVAPPSVHSSGRSYLWV